MKTRATMLLATAAIAAGALPMVAQDDATAAPVTIISNAEFCALVSEDAVVCEGVLTGMATAGVLPQAFADVITVAPGAEPVAVPSADAGAAASSVPVAEGSPAPTDDPVALESSAETTEAATPAGVGDTLSRDDLRITLVKADWKPDISDSFYQPGKGRKYVSFLVRYEALEDGARYEIINWDALDKAGKRYEAEVLGQITPDLKVGDLAAGEKVQGWVTYEVPQDVNQLQIIESQVLEDDLTWTSRR